MHGGQFLWLTRSHFCSILKGTAVWINRQQKRSCWPVLITFMLNDFLPGMGAYMLFFLLEDNRPSPAGVPMHLNVCAWWEMEYSSAWQRILSINIYIELDHNKLQIILHSRLHSLVFSIILILRGLGGRDHFQTIPISFSRRALYWNLGKYSRQTKIFITIYWNLDWQLVYRVMG